MAAVTDPPLLPNHTYSIIPITLPIATKLTDSNYLTWKSQIYPLLTGYNLSQFIDRNFPPPSQTIPGSDGGIVVNPAYLTWLRQDQLLLAWIRSSLTEVVQAQVVSCSTTADLWHTLSSNFSSSSRARLTDLRRRLQTCSKGSSSCSDYLQQIRKIADELAFIGSPVSDDDLVLSALNGLGPDFNSFVVAVTTASRNDPLRFSDLRGLLLGHESLLSTQSPATTLPSLSSPSAFYARPNNQFGSKNPRQPKPSYFPNPNPSKPNNPRPNYTPAGSSAFVPRAPFNPRYTAKYKGPEFTCQICSKQGHSAKICYWRFTPDSNSFPAPTTPPAPPFSTTINPPFQAFTAQPSSAISPSHQEWVIDSGATNHVTSDLNNLTSFYSYNGADHLQTGSGLGLPIEHIGQPNHAT